MRLPVGVSGAEDLELKFDFVKSKYAFERPAVQWVAHSGMTCMIKGKY